MGRKVAHPILDLMLSQAEGTHIHVLTDEPADFAGIAALELASGVISGSYAKANGGGGGRQNTVPAQSGLNIDTSGEADHIAISDGSGTLFLVTTCPAQTLTSGGTVDVNSFAHTIADPL